MRIHKMTTRMSSHSVVGALMLILNISIAAAAFAADATSEQKLTVAEKLDVASLDKASYKDFLQRLRNTLAASRAGTIPVLPPANDKNPQWLDLTLTGSGGKMTIVKIRVENLYVVGYQMQNPQKWLELGKKGDQQWIPNSEFLGFRGNYDDMVKAAGKKVTEISLTQFAFDSAVATLDKSTVTRDRAQALILVAQMVSEACRFIVNSNYIASNLFSSSPVYITEWMLEDVEKNWSKFSTILQCYYAYLDKYVYTPVKINGKEISTVQDLGRLLGILLKEETGKSDCKISYNDQVPKLFIFKHNFKTLNPRVFKLEAFHLL